MPQGINGDLADITLYTNTTPVEFTSSNVPLSELDTNIVLLDQKLEGWVQTGSIALSEAGDGNYSFPIVFTTTMNTSPRIVFGLQNLTCFATCTSQVAGSALSTAGFTANIIISGTGGAWTGRLDWMADGR
jgi:hypothetical protein